MKASLYIESLLPPELPRPCSQPFTDLDPLTCNTSAESLPPPPSPSLLEAMACLASGLDDRFLGPPSADAISGVVPSDASQTQDQFILRTDDMKQHHNGFFGVNISSNFGFNRGPINGKLVLHSCGSNGSGGCANNRISNCSSSGGGSFSSSSGEALFLPNDPLTDPDKGSSEASELPPGDRVERQSRPT
ncbi:unnamed protein product [Protopolystoma xenopodis]|uniref:Uncharacterized protein n=1 Tax=Protopolystoma xenopodis TaxID=117903 RepID=A0A3S5B1F3_9PLAT|nr:unnamed protein product [Protopolystoma xenopodis]